MRFTKMHGLGNDYVYVNCFEETVENPSELAIAVSIRHSGIGSDGLILICPSDSADVRMRMFNADGSEAEMCGNGIRCVAKYAIDHGLSASSGEFSAGGQGTFSASLNIETLRGILTVGLETGDDGKVSRVCVNMGQPILTAADIPVDFNSERVVNEPIGIVGQNLSMTCVSMGNPHAVFFCDDIDGIDLAGLGPTIENHPFFPQRINAHFVKVQSANEFTMRTWERGSGITMACGTGACACAVAAVLNGKSERSVLAHLPGGDLELNWCEDDNCVYMTGPAVEVFSGEFDLS
ncbi:MAG TPA: diaminopimelate epimerase [Phycisphaerales bacterium]|nr:diaminopimelate epimerase [Phycisphaerales bacterium]